MREIVRQLIHSLQAGRKLAFCRLVETRGSTPQKAGALMLVYPDGSQAGTLGGGCVEAEVKRRALAVAATGAAEVACFQLDSDYGWDDGLICGGRMQILVEPLEQEGTAYRLLAVVRWSRTSESLGVMHGLEFLPVSIAESRNRRGIRTIMESWERQYGSA